MKPNARLPSILDLVGGTPLVEIRKVGRERLREGVSILAKLEGSNPGGSVKDRPALAMLRRAEETGRLAPGKTVLDATSGNTGIALAWIGAALGHRVKLCVPANASPERLKTLRAHGADLVLTDPRHATDGAQRECRRLAAEEPHRYVYLDQYNNEANWRSHYETTAAEILEQTGRRIDRFVAGLGTSGTFVGTARRLKEAIPGVRCVSFQPDSPLHGLEGLKHMPTALVPGIYDPAVADEDRACATEAAHAMVLRLAREEGLFAGVSSGAALAVAIEVARGLEEGVVVTVFPDGGGKYLSERFWEDDG